MRSFFILSAALLLRDAPLELLRMKRGSRRTKYEGLWARVLFLGSAA